MGHIGRNAAGHIIMDSDSGHIGGCGCCCTCVYTITATVSGFSAGRCGDRGGDYPCSELNGIYTMTPVSWPQSCDDYGYSYGGTNEHGHEATLSVQDNGLFDPMRDWYFKIGWWYYMWFSYRCYYARANQGHPSCMPPRRGFITYNAEMADASSDIDSEDLCYGGSVTFDWEDA
jgi:hypothetical protein